MIACYLIDHSLIDATVKRHYEQIRYCYEKRLPQHPTMEGSFTMRFQLQPGGAITFAEIRDSTLDNPEVEACVRDAFASCNWPPGPVEYVVNYPLSFRVGPPRHRE